MTLPDGLRLNEYGFYEVTSKPSPAELRDYYARRYYQENRATYQARYSPEELEYLEGRLQLKYFMLGELTGLKDGELISGGEDAGAAGQDFSPSRHPITPSPHHAPTQSPTFLDIGSGEGWALAFFQRRGWNVLGVDFSAHGLAQFHPDLRARLRAGDLYEEVEKLAAEGRRFDALWLDNVLEHVLDPAALLHLCRRLVAPGGALVVEVPNDFSPLQQHLLAAGHIDRPFWVVLPDHLSYFNPAGLANLAAATGWHLTRTLADPPIDLHLLTPATNYVQDRAAGPAAHRARVAQDNLLLRTAPLARVAAYYEAMAGVGLGRNLIAYLRPA